MLDGGPVARPEKTRETAGWLGLSWQQPASRQRGGLGSGGVALRALARSNGQRHPVLDPGKLGSFAIGVAECVDVNFLPPRL